MDRRKIDVGMSSFLIVAAIIILTNDSLSQGGVETDLGSMFLPRLVAACMMVISAVIGVQALRALAQRKPASEDERIDTRGFDGVAIYIGTFVLYWLAVPQVGFLLATPFAMMAIAVLLGGRSWLPMGLVSVIVPVAVFYLCREYLRVFLPTWSL